MDILMVAAELSPYVRQTPAADAIAALCKALRQLGHDVTVALPRHLGFETGGLLMARRLTPLSLPGGTEVTVLDGQLASGTKLVLFDAPALFDRTTVYGDKGDEQGESAKRFGLLAQAAVALAQLRAEQGDAFDVMHLHDFPGALAALVLKASPDVRLPTVLTIHDGRRDGTYPAKEAETLGISRELAASPELRVGGKVSALKGAVHFANAVTTVSATYARELGDPDVFGPLGEALAQHQQPVIGITSGIDYAMYNPATDSVLASRYDAEDPANKGRCKTALLRSLGLELELTRPLLALVGPVDKASGFQVLTGALPAILKNDVSVVVIGTSVGDAALRERLAGLASETPERVALVDSLEPARLRQAYAAADFVLLAQRELPCGDAQMIAQRYGALPVAHATGGIVDTIVDCDEQLETGTGFLFDKLTQKGVLGAVERAIAAYRSPAWPRLVRRVMRLDLAWDRPARRYVQVYRQAQAR
jgi:starch synthase